MLFTTRTSSLTRNSQHTLTHMDYYVCVRQIKRDNINKTCIKLYKKLYLFCLILHGFTFNPQMKQGRSL